MTAASRLDAGVETVHAPPRSPAEPRRGDVRQTGSMRASRWGFDSLRRRMLAVSDLVAGAAAGTVLASVSTEPSSALVWAFGFLPVWIALAKLHGLYDRDHRAVRHLTVDEGASLASWAATGVAGLALLLTLASPGEITVPGAVLAWLAATACGFVFRSTTRALWRRFTPPEQALIVGDGELVMAIKRKMALLRDMHMQPIGAAQRSDLLENMIRDADRLIIASSDPDGDRVAELVYLCRQHEVKLSVVSPMRLPQSLTRVADLSLLEYNTWDVSRSTMLLKRVTDIVISAAALVLLSPLLLAVALAIRFDSRGRIIFSQHRAGLNGQPFRMYKLRTMSSDAEDRLVDVVSLDELTEPMFKLRSDPRVTRVGRFLRRTSLDELPQFFNVLRGDMSLVGPRPEQIELVRRYRPEHLFRLAVKPGLTGPMQVFGRGDLTFEERLAVERDYVENLSLARDMRILTITAATVLRGNGAY